MVVISLQDQFRIRQSDMPEIRRVYNAKAARRYSDLLHQIRYDYPIDRPTYLSEEIHKRIMESMNDPDFMDKSAKAKLSRSKGSKHTGGSKPFHEHMTQLVSIYYEYFISTWKYLII